MADPDGRAINRPSARSLIVDARDRILLFRIHDPTLTEPDLWATPGRGLEPGEGYEDAVRREVREETGLWAPRIGPWVWSRSHRWTWRGRTMEVRERFYVLRVDSLEVSTVNWEDNEREVTKEIRWWSVAEIAEAATEVFVPRRMAELVAPIVAGELTASPVETGL